MPVENKLSAAIANRIATPSVLNPAEGSILRPFKTIPAVFAVAAADDDNSTFRIARLPSSAIVTSIFVANTAITGGSAYDFGAYQTAANGGAVVDVDNLANDVSMASARTVLTDIYTPTITNRGRRLWEVLGLTADPVREYDIVMTAATIGSADGTVVVSIEYLN